MFALPLEGDMKYFKVSLWKDINDKEIEYVKGFGLPLNGFANAAIVRKQTVPANKIVPFVTMPDVTIDLFDGRAWIGRKQYPARQARKADLSPDHWFQYHFDADPGILYARVNNSDVGSEDGAQTLAFVVAAEKLTQKEQATISVNALAAYGKRCMQRRQQSRGEMLYRRRLPLWYLRERQMQR